MKLKLYHGSRDEIVNPKLGRRTTDKEYGDGFYMTQDREKAKEWALSNNPIKCEGYVHEYELDTDGLEVCFIEEEYGLFELLAIISKNKEYLRNIISTKEMAIELIEKYYDEYFEEYDIVVGHRFDGRYMHFIEKAIQGEISIEYLEELLKTMSNEQENYVVVLKTNKAIKKLEERTREPIDDKGYMESYMKNWKDVADKLDRVVKSHRNDRCDSIYKYIRPRKTVYVN